MTAKLRHEAMLAALAGQLGGCRYPDDGIAWYVEETDGVTAGERLVKLHIARWTATGRVVKRDFMWLRGETPRVFEAFGRMWKLHDDYNVRPSPPTGPVATAFNTPRATVLTPVEFRDAPTLSDAAKARAKYIAKGNDTKAQKAYTEAVFNVWPEGFRMLPRTPGKKPMLYRVTHGVGGFAAPKSSVETKSPRRALVFGVPADDPAAWRRDVFYLDNAGVVQIDGETYALAPMGQELYRPGGPEDAWSFPEVSAEAELRFNEMRPEGSVKLPGYLAWYMVAGNRRVARITWYNARRQTVHEHAAVRADGVMSWRNHTFYLNPVGELVLQNPPTL